MADDRWVLTGRDEERRFALDVLGGETTHAGLVLSGAAGVGKSRLASEVLASLPEDVVVVRAIATHTAIPFAPLAHLLGDDGDDGDEGPRTGGRLEPPDLLWALRRIRGRLVELAAGAPLVLAVDDAHLLDEASATLVRQLARAGQARLLLTVRSGEPCPEDVTALWRDDVCAQLELQALARTEVGELCAHVLGAWLEQDSLDRLFTASGGNPLVLRELLADARATGGLSEHRGLLRWHGVAATPRLTSLVEADLGRLDDDGRAFVDVLAVGEPVPVAVARTLTSLDVLAGLERAGVVTVDELDDHQVRLAHPLFGEVRRAQLGPLQVTAAEAALADAFQRAGCDDADDRLRVACWHLNAGTKRTPSRLLDAAHHARSRGDADLAERLARAARAADPTPETDLLLAELAEADGRAAEAADLLDGLAARLDADDQRARAITARIRVLALVLGRPEEAEAAAAQVELIADPIWHAFVRAQWATTMAMLGRVDDAARLGAELFALPDDRVRLRALPAVNLAAYAAGRLDEALATAQSMVGPALANGDEVPAGTSVVFSALALDLAALGRLDELDQLLALATDPVATLPSSRAYLLGVEGSLLLRRGRIARARRLLSESVELFTGGDPQGFRAATAALLAQACVHGGDATAAASAAAEATTAMAARPPRLVDLDSRRACAWAPVADGDPASARRALLEVAEAARAAGHPLFEMSALHDAVRLGAGRTAQRRLWTVASTVDGERAAAVTTHARALLDDDAAALEAAGGSFADLGELLVAAEVLAEASRRHGASGRHDASRRTALRARAVLASCEGATLPTGLTTPGPTLTPRELQVARLAASGRSSKQIAAELVVSVRTVDNQLSRVYTKLGIGGRHELAAAIDDLAGDVGHE